MHLAERSAPQYQELTAHTQLCAQCTPASSLRALQKRVLLVTRGGQHCFGSSGKRAGALTSSLVKESPGHCRHLTALWLEVTTVAYGCPHSIRSKINLGNPGANLNGFFVTGLLKAFDKLVCPMTLKVRAAVCPHWNPRTPSFLKEYYLSFVTSE